MNEKPEKQSKQERLAAKLRENLHRRKAQARATSETPVELSKPDPSR